MIQNSKTGFQQTKSLIPLKVLFGNSEKSAPKISPDGTRLTYVAPQNNVLNIWIRTIGKQDDKIVTQDKKRGIRGYFWGEDNSHIIYLQDSDGDENWHIYSVDLNNGITRDLTPFLGIQAQVVAQNPNFPNQILVGLNLRDRRLHDVYRVNLDTGALEMDTENPGDVTGFDSIGWIADPKFQIRGAMAVLPDGRTQLRVRNTTQDTWRPLVTWEAEDSFCHGLSFTPDGKGIYVLDSRNVNTTRIIKIDISTGQESLVAYDPEYDAESAMIHPRTHQLQAAFFIKERDYWQVLDSTIEKDIETIKRIHLGDFSVINRDHADQNWLIQFIADNGPIAYYIYHRATRKSTFLFTNHPDLEQYILAPMKPITIKSRDGLTLHGYLTLPVGGPARNLPLVLRVHGGPWGRDRWWCHPEVQLFANRGYACLQVNFRGSTGYGKAFVNAGNHEWGAKMHDDLIDAVNWAINEGIADPKRIAIYGVSYGGYAALVGAAFTPDVFNCAVSQCGPSNIVTLFKSYPPYMESFMKTCKQRTGDPDTEEEFLKSRSPLFRAHQIKIPMLIAQGANDPRVKQTESEQIVQILRSKDKPVEYLLFPDEGHGFVKPENRLKFYATVEAFLAKQLTR